MILLPAHFTDLSSSDFDSNTLKMFTGYISYTFTCFRRSHGKILHHDLFSRWQVSICIQASRSGSAPRSPALSSGSAGRIICQGTRQGYTDTCRCHSLPPRVPTRAVRVLSLIIIPMMIRKAKNPTRDKSHKQKSQAGQMYVKMQKFTFLSHFDFIHLHRLSGTSRTLTAR